MRTPPLIWQVGIFFALLSSIVLKADPHNPDVARILSVMLLVPPLLGVFLETALPNELYKCYSYLRARLLRAETRSDLSWCTSLHTYWPGLIARLAIQREALFGAEGRHMPRAIVFVCACLCH